MTPCPHCFGDHDPDTPETWVEWPEGTKTYPPFLCLCCGKETCARQFAFGRMCGICDAGICQRDERYFHPPYVSAALRGEEAQHE